MSKVEVSIIIACYNEGPTFESSVKRVVEVLENLNKKWEIIFVEDKSNDETKNSVEKFADGLEGASAIYHSKNMGRGKSVSDGIKAAKGRICGFLDIDLEVDAKYIEVFVNEIEKGADMTIGVRFYDHSLKSLPRVVASKLYSTTVSSLLKIPLADTETGYKFFNRSKILPIVKKSKNKGWFWDTEICARTYWAGLKISQVPVLFNRRRDKKSTVRLIPDSFEYLKQLLKFRSQIPRSL